jgi:hypothetical protein
VSNTGRFRLSLRRHGSCSPCVDDVPQCMVRGVIVCTLPRLQDTDRCFTWAWRHGAVRSLSVRSLDKFSLRGRNRDTLINARTPGTWHSVAGRTSCLYGGHLIRQNRCERD